MRPIRRVIHGVRATVRTDLNYVLAPEGTCAQFFIRPTPEAGEDAISVPIWFSCLDDLTGMIEILQEMADEWAEIETAFDEADAREEADHQRCIDARLKGGGVK